MDCIKVNGRPVKDKQLMPGPGLSLIQEYVSYQKDILRYITSFRTNHTYERLEHARRVPSFVGNPPTTDRKFRIDTINSKRLVNGDRQIKPTTI